MEKAPTYNENGDGFLSWLKKHSYMIIVAIILIVGDWAVFGYRVDDFEEDLKQVDKDIKEVQVKTEANKAKIQALELQYARDLTEIKTILMRVDQSVGDLILQQREREKDIIEFYRKYGSKLDNLINE